MAFLPVKGRDGGCVDDHTARAVCIRRILRHHFGGKAGDVKAASQIDLQGFLEALKVMGAVAPQRPFAGRDPGAINGSIELAHPITGLCQRSADRVGISDIGLDETGVDLGGQCGAFFSVHIQKRDLRASCTQRLGCGRTQARCAAGDDCCYGFEIHVALRSLAGRYLRCLPAMRNRVIKALTRPEQRSKPAPLAGVAEW